MVIPPCADEVMIGICCPVGDRGFRLVGLGDAGGAARLERGMYGVYVVCGAEDGCRGGGSTGPNRGGGDNGECSGVRETFDRVGVVGGERKGAEDDGLPAPDGEELPFAGNLSG